MKHIYPFLNPLAWLKAYRFVKKNIKYDKYSDDNELDLYSKILTNNMLHYGYFENVMIKPEEISFQLFENAQLKYAENIIDYILDSKNSILDVGCGMGGLLQLLYNHKFKIEGVTPNKNQISFIEKNHKHLKVHFSKFEAFESDKKYGTVINSESLQYIQLHEAFEKIDKITLPKARWIVVDYFSLTKKKDNQKPHHLDTFYKKSKDFNWHIVYQINITPNILPTLFFVNMYVERFLLPLKSFAYNKLRIKKPKLYYLAKKLRDSIDKKVNKEISVVNPSIFEKERKYMFIVLEKNLK